MPRTRTVRRAAARKANWSWEALDPRGILRWRKANGVSRRALAEALGVSEGSLFSWEREGHAPRPEVQRRLEAFLSGRPVPLPPPTSVVSADEIVAFRRRHGWSRERLARMLGVSESAVHGWEHNVRQPSLLFRAKLHAVLFAAEEQPLAKSKPRRLTDGELEEIADVVGAVVKIVHAYETRHALGTGARRSLRAVIVDALVDVPPPPVKRTRGGRGC